MKKETALYIIVGIALIIIVVATALSFIGPKETSLEVLSNSKLHNGENFTINLTENGTGLANKPVNVTFIDANGNKNTVNLVTDNQGIASITLAGVTPGYYRVECEFAGDDDYMPTNLTVSIEVQDNTPVEETTSSVSENSYGGEAAIEEAEEYGNDLIYSTFLAILL